MLRLRNRIAGIFITVVGGIFLIVAVFMFVSSGWTTTTATAGGCVPSGQTGATTTSRVYHDYCQMTWVEAGVTHTGMLDTGRTNIHPGTTFTVKVSGDSIAMPSAVVVPAGHPRRRGGRRRRRADPCAAPATIAGADVDPAGALTAVGPLWTQPAPAMAATVAV